MRRLMILLILAMVARAEAAVRVWDGDGANALWTTAQNWIGDVAPLPGDALVFPGGAAQLTNTNDFSSATGFGSIRIESAGYRLQGNETFLPDGITTTYATGISTIALPIRLPQPLPVNVQTAGTTLVLEGVLSGSGPLTKLGAGTLRLTASNTFSFGMDVHAGIVEGAPAASPATPFGSGAVRLHGGRVTGLADDLDALVAVAGTGAPRPRFSADSVILAGPSTYEVHFTPIGVTRMSAQNGVTLNQPALVVAGVPRPLDGVGFEHVIIENLSANPTAGTFAGLPEGTTITSANRTYRISYQGGTGNDVSLIDVTPSVVWDGGGTNNLWSTDENWVGDAEPHAGDVVSFPAGAARLTATNDTFLLFQSITIGGAGYLLNGPSIDARAFVATYPAGTSTIDSWTLAIGPPVTFRVTEAAATLVISGRISGPDSLLFDGAGTIDITGIEETNDGFTKRGSGTLLEREGSGLRSEISVLEAGGVGILPGTDPTREDAVGPIRIENGILFGTTVVRGVTANGGRIAPGATPESIGTLRTGDTVLNASSTLDIQIAAPDSFDQLVVGGVTIHDATLTVSASPGLPAGTSFTIINVGSGATTGTFAGLAEGAQFAAGGTTFRITYQGGDGNDVVLTAVATDADLALSQSVSPATPAIGQFVTFRVTVTNNGPASATGVSVTDTPPANVTVLDVQTSHGTCSGTQAIVCSIGTLAVGSSATITIVGRVTATGPLTNSATATANEPDPNSANNVSVSSSANGLAAGNVPTLTETMLLALAALLAALGARVLR